MRAATILPLAVLMLTLAAGSARADALQSPVGSASSVLPLQGSPPTLDSTLTTVSPNPANVTPGNAIAVTASVLDISVSPLDPTGEVRWGDNGAGGNFTATDCVLVSSSSVAGQCSVSYVPPASSVGSEITLTATYVGDANHLSSEGQSVLNVNAPTSTAISPNSALLTNGQPTNFTATVTDTSGASKSSPSGTVIWSDGGVGGKFKETTCTLSPVTNASGSCSVEYQPPPGKTVALTVTITASYSGDTVDAPGSGTATVTFIPPQVPMTVNVVLVGSSKGVLAPTFTYTLSNETKTVVLTATPTSYEVDVNSEWFVPNQLGNSSQGDAWNLHGGAQGKVSYSFGTANGGTTMTFVYYHQYQVDLGYQVVGGTPGSSIAPFVTYTSFGVTLNAGAPGQTWVDVGTSYAYPALIPGSLGNVRWIAQNVSGIATGPGNLSPTYYHQYSLSVSFAVKDSPGNQAAPTFFAVSMGSGFNVSLASLTTNLWLDAGSKYSFTDPLSGGNSTVRWSAGSSASGLVTDSDIAVTYYQQYAIAASFTITDGSASSQVTKGVSTPVFPSLAGVSANKNVTVPLETQPQQVWLDSGTSYFISSVLLANPGERWVATANVTGTVAVGATALQTYYHEYLLKVSYSEPGAPSSAQSINYTMLGTQTQSPLTAQGSTVWADAGTQFFVPDALAGDRWYAPNAPDGLASSNMTVTYYHQYQIQVSLGVVGGALPAQSSISGTSGGQPFKALLGTETVGVWLDSGTNYAIPQRLLQLPAERWIAAANVTGTLTSPASVTQLYYHQVLLNLSYSGAPPASAPTIEYISFGENAQSVMGQAGSPVWADVGDSFSVQNVISGGTGERWHSGLLGGNVTAPIQEDLRFFHQYLVSYSYTPIGGVMALPPTLTVVEAGKSASLDLTSQTAQVWADAGSGWQTSLAPSLQQQQGERWLSSGPTQGTIAGPASLHLQYVLEFLVTTAASPASGGTVTSGGWYNASSDITLQAVPGHGWALGRWDGLGTGAYTGTNATLSIPVLSAMNETAQFEPGLTIISSNGGSVRYTTGPSVQSINPGQSVQTFVTGNGQVTLEAHASFPYQFVKWTGIDTNTSDPLSLSVSAPMVIQAVFAPNYLDLIGLPAAVFAICLTIYLARHLILASWRQVLQNLKVGGRT